MSILKNILIKASGNYLMQCFLERNVLLSQSLMGIGSGHGVFVSGERAIFQVLKTQNKQSPYCIFDAGANKGQFLQLSLANLLNEDFRIHCFEPGRETFESLSQSFSEDKRVVLNNIGLSKEKGKGILHYEQAGSTLHL